MDVINKIDRLAILESLELTYASSRKLVHLTDETIQDILYKLAALTMERSAYILQENQKDLDRMDRANPKYDRLLLNEERLFSITEDLKKVADLSSPLNNTLEERDLPNGLHLLKKSVPLGVVSIVFESRPNVTFDVFALCLKSGNASILKGSRDAHFSNIAIVSLIHEVLEQYDLKEVCYLAPSAREALGVILEAEDLINIIIPRGGQGLIKFVRENASVPVIETGAGIVHTYFDKSGDLEKGKAIIENAKSRRVSVCNALDTLIIHKDRLSELPQLLQNLGENHQCKVFADQEAFSILSGQYPSTLLFPATEDSFGTEFLSMQMSVKTVACKEDACEHIAQFSSKHSEAIIAESPDAVAYFLNTVDAAVVYANASTAFTDGAQFGLGAEIGISTQKLHARGPMALKELTSYKWVVKGSGQTRG